MQFYDAACIVRFRPASFLRIIGVLYLRRFASFSLPFSMWYCFSDILFLDNTWYSFDFTSLCSPVWHIVCISRSWFFLFFLILLHLYQNGKASIRELRRYENRPEQVCFGMDQNRNPYIEAKERFCITRLCRTDGLECLGMDWNGDRKPISENYFYQHRGEV